MVAFKEEFPYLRCDSGQLFEFDRNWLHAAINRAADKAGYPSWWLTEHVTESIAFYLHLRNDENVVAFKQLQETVQYVLKAIGYKEIIPYFAPAPPPISISLVDIAHQAGSGYELAFFDLLEKRLNSLIETGVDTRTRNSCENCLGRRRRNRFSRCQSAGAGSCADRSEKSHPAIGGRDRIRTRDSRKIIARRG
jgi:hypothetical protein